ncbi:MAG: hypothetical protein AAB571_01770 [Chloroflexota bacterium]
MYQTLRATVRNGQIALLDKTKLPNNIMLLVTVIEDVSPQTLTLGEHLVRGLSDVARKRVTRIRTKKQLRQHLDKILG